MLFEGESVVKGVHPVFGGYSIGEFTGKDTSGGCCLAIDLGATKTVFGVFSIDNSDCLFTAYFKSGDKDVFLKQFDMVAKMARERSLDITVVSIGAAGPVVGNRSTFLTNLKWQLNSDELKFPDVSIYNDFEAIGYGIRFLDHSNPEQIVQLNNVKLTKDGAIAIIGPGTGLGICLIHGGEVMPSEGGHMALVVRTEEGLRLVEFLKRMLHTKEHPDWDSVVSGPGIVNLYRFVMQDPKLEVDPAWITGSKDIGARTATDLFVEFLARAASDLALVSKATGGLYLAGGILPKLRNKLVPHFTDTFLENYRRSIRSGVLEKVPIFLVVEERVSLLGLVSLARKEPVAKKGQQGQK
jgi:glucokinase